jgi:hypothetical protein
MRSALALLALTFALTGCAGPEKTVDSTDPMAGAHKLYVSKCAKCHKFYDPTKYSDEDWATWMGKMSKKAKLKPDQAEALARYIELTYRSSSRTNIIR